MPEVLFKETACEKATNIFYMVVCFPCNCCMVGMWWCAGKQEGI